MSNIKDTVMQRVHTMHRVRPFMRVGVVALALLALALSQIGHHVWVARVFENAPHVFDLMAHVSFWIGAFLGTGLLVKSLVLGSIIATFVLARESAQMLTLLVNRSYRGA